MFIYSFIYLSIYRNLNYTDVHNKNKNKECSTSLQNNYSQQALRQKSIKCLAEKGDLTLVIKRYDQSGHEPLDLENGSFLNSDNLDAIDLRF